MVDEKKRTGALLTYRGPGALLTYRGPGGQGCAEARGSDEQRRLTPLQVLIVIALTAFDGIVVTGLLALGMHAHPRVHYVRVPSSASIPVPTLQPAEERYIQRLASVATDQLAAADEGQRLLAEASQSSAPSEPWQRRGATVADRLRASADALDSLQPPVIYRHCQQEIVAADDIHRAAADGLTRALTGSESGALTETAALLHVAQEQTQAGLRCIRETDRRILGDP